ncbi:MAG: tail fiber domain-containing protein [Planctomycetota bacterium]
MKLTIWSVLVCCLCVRPTLGQEVLILTGNNPNVAFVDDSTNPDRKWQILANVAGFKVRDITEGIAVSEPFHLDLGLPNNALRVTKDTNGQVNVGIGGIATDQKNLHIQSVTNVRIRMEKTGFGSERTWDIVGSNTGLFVADVTNSSTIPFSIHPGARANTLVLDSTGNVGIGTGAPDANSRLEIRSSLTNGLLAKRTDANAHFLRVENTGGIFRAGVQGNGDAQFGALSPGKGLNLLAGGVTKVLVNSKGQISFGNAPPTITDKALVHASTAHLTLGGIWTNASSRALKQDIEPITSEQARDTVRALQPVGYRYKSELDERYVGFIAEDVPELVATNDRKGLAPMDITAVLTKVVQDQDQQLADERRRNDEQQQLIAALTQRLTALEQRSVETDDDSTP